MKKILLIYGGNSPEHNISILSSESILNNIDTKKYTLDKVLITRKNEWIFNDKKVDNIIEFIKQYDIVFPIIHGINGEDGRLQGMLELFNIKYVGSKCGPSYLCIDKERTKQILNYNKIPQVPYQVYDNIDNVYIPFPIIVKPATGGSSIGISIAYNKRELKRAIKTAQRYDKKIILEQFLTDVQELECAILEDNKLIVSDIGEIIHNNKFYDFEEKYNSENINTTLSANIDKKIKKQIKMYAEKAFKCLELNGLARIDFFYSNGKIYLNEINTLPGFTKTSMYPQLIEDYGIPYKDLLTKLIENIK